MNLRFRGKRTSFKFSPLASRQLDELRHRARLPKDSDVLRAAIDVLAYLIEFVGTGGQIFLQSGDGRRLWPYTPYAPPVDYPHFDLAWSQEDAEGLKERRTFTFTGEMVDRVQAVKIASRFQSDSDVVRASIAVFHELLSAISANDRIILRTKRGVDRPYNPFDGTRSKAMPALPLPTQEILVPEDEVNTRRKKRRAA